MATDISGEVEKRLSIDFEPEPTTTDISGEVEERLSIDFEPEGSVCDIAGETEGRLDVHFEPETSFTAGTTQSEDFAILMWYAGLITSYRQWYEDIYFIEWDAYVETAISEFNRYELHRKPTTFTPEPGDATLVFSTTNIANNSRFDVTGDAAQTYYYRVIVVLDDGRYAVMPEVVGDKKPVWDNWPDALIANDGAENVPRGQDYTVECDTATDDGALTPYYAFQYCKSFTTPEDVWNYAFDGTDSMARYVFLEDRHPVIGVTTGVKVNDVLWTLAGDEVSDLAGYGPTDEVYIFDSFNNVIVFGDDTNGKLPANGADIKIDFSDWNDIETSSDLTDTEQTWAVPAALPLGSDYAMRVFCGVDPSDFHSGYADISAATFSVQPTMPQPVLVEPPHGSIETTYFPRFNFYLPYQAEFDGNVIKWKIEVADNAAFTTNLKTFKQYPAPVSAGSWSNSGAPPGTYTQFRPATTDPITTATGVPPWGDHYWRVTAYNETLDVWSVVSQIWQFSITDATYRWRIGLLGSEIEFLPKKQGWNVTVEQIGREQVEKRVFRCNFAEMQHAQRELLWAEFNRKAVLSLYDNLGIRYDVYWGTCERALSGKALPPDKPNFGIVQKNYIPGAIRYGGEAIFTEV